MRETKIPFRPIRCIEADLEKISPIEGHVVFTTDSRKIFAVVDNEFKMMGGSTGIFYGIKQLTEEEKLGDETIFSFLPSDIDGDELPAEDDLILNIPDGGFYRVLNVNNVDLRAQRIAISGGGSGGGGGGGTSAEGLLAIEFLHPENGVGSTITGVDYYLEFNIVAKDALGNNISDREEGVATWMINGKTYTSKVYPGKNSFKVDQYLDPTQNETKIVLAVSMNTGGGSNNIASRTFRIKAVDLKLEWDWNYDPINYISEDTFTLKFTPYGGVNCVAHIVFDDTLLPEETYFTKEIPSYNTGREVYSNALPRLDYGVHTCSMYLTAEVNGEEYRTPSISHEITFIEGGNATILTVPYYQTTATQYDTLNIPFMVYDPDEESCEVVFLVNDIEIGSDTYDRSLHYWPYTLSEYGAVKLSIKSKNNDVKKDIELVINKLELDVNEVDGYAFSLKANNFSSNNEIRNWNYKGITLSFSDNFDWENGGLQTEILADGSIQKYICVRQGTRMTVNYNLFQATNTARDGKNFKICFKATNCYDYEAPILTCYESDTKLGVRMDAQKTTFSTATYPNFATQYYENSYIELETEIWPNVADPDPAKNLYGDRFLMFWVDGIPAGVQAYPTSEKFTHLTPQPIEIGSDLCDVYIYVMKVYERRLTENEHLNNFIIDAPSTNEMMARYKRNNIIDNSGEISYTKLIENNPDCHAYVYKIPKMTTSKDDKIGNCEYFELHGEYNSANNPYYRAINEKGKGARIRVQGTSSAAYGVAAFNLRTEFQEGVIDSTGEQADGWKSTETAIPIDYICTKVNVASCENANNVVNQEWYNKFQPYHDAHRRKTRDDGTVYRDTMEFNSGVIFVLDENPETNYYGDDGKPSRDGYLKANIFLDTKDYTKKPYYKMYSIGNMGNDKKNIHIFHDINNPKACCVEVADNQNAEHWMTVYNPDAFEEKVIGKDEDGKDIKEGPYYEFRYSVDDCEADDKQGITAKIQEEAFMNFVKWMAESDPSPYHPDSHPYGYTEEELPAPITYGEYTFKGFDPPGYEGKANPTGISLKGLKISKYAGTYTHDTHEYRMAKMLNECEDHLVMDSIVFHYLFIQRHTMVDNVAKNTFWSTEDLIHWDLTKDYDNDTSDGNDNSGYLTFTYGIEALDKDEVGDDIYNAAPSVWINFIHNLSDAQEKLYKDLEGKGAWNAKEYLEEFKKHQNIIPERCWIYDYFRKYIRPRRLGLDENTYLNRLEGGKKTHQRTQYETYQQFYMNSKYMAGTVFTDGAAIDLRLNTNPSGEWNTANVLPASFYIDCYASCHLGGQYKQSGRLKRGDIYNFPVGTMVQNPHDATCYIYGANMLQTLAGLSEVYPNYANLATASKLREIEFGSDAEGYYNANLTSPNIGSNAMLQNAYIQNSGVPTGMGSLDLTKATQLKELKLNGSTATELALADGSTIELLYLNPLTTLTMSNLSKLDDIQLDEGIYETLSDITIKNCPAFDDYAYQLALRAPINYYAFNDFVWTITEATEDHLVYDNGKVVGIKVLDKLLEERRYPQQGMTTATAMSGKIIIDGNCFVDEFAVYERYSNKTKFPNIIIEYGSQVGKVEPKAVEFKFMNGEDENAAIFYRVLGRKGESNVGALISEAGPVGEAMGTPFKSDTDKNTYTFTGYWKDTSGKKYYVDGLANAEGSAINFNNLVPSEDKVFYPIFKEEVKKHLIKFFDYDGNVILQNGKETFGVPYGLTYKAAGGPLTNFYYKDSSDLPDEKRYGFKGWTTSKFKVDEGKNVIFIDLDNYVIEKAMNLYPYYETENVYEVPSSMEYFEVINGHTLRVKEKYQEALQGKITIPAVAGVVNIEKIGCANSSKSSKITHVYFMPDCKIITVKMSAFSYSKELVMVNLPNTVRIIEGSAFTGCPKLKTVTLTDEITSIGGGAFQSCPSLEINKLPNNLTELGSAAFMSSGPGVKITSLPIGIFDLYSYTFYGCPNVKISVLGGSNNESALSSVGLSCFATAGKGTEGPALESLTIGSSIETVGDQAFSSYGNIKEVTINLANGESTNKFNINAIGLGGAQISYYIDGVKQQ